LEHPSKKYKQETYQESHIPTSIKLARATKAEW
jgi:hypothetical protein